MSSSLYRRLHGLFTTTAAAFKTAKPASKTVKPASKTAKPVSKATIPISEPAKLVSESAKPASKRRKPTSQVQKLKFIVKKFKKDSRFDGFRLRIPHYESVVRRLAAANQFSLIEEILEHQKKFKDITNERFVVRLISLYGKSGMFDHANKLFDKMPELNCERTVLSFNALLAACVNSKKFYKIEELFRELPEKLAIEPDIVSYNTVIKSFCQMGSLDSASQVIELMETNGLEPNLITFNTLLDAFYRDNKLSEAEKLWTLMENKNLVPDVRSYNPKLRQLVADNRISEAVDLIEEMRTKGVRPDTYSFNALIKGFCDDKNLEEAKRWYGEIAKSDLVPDRVTFDIILPFVCDMAAFDYGFELCKEVINLKHRVSITAMQRVVDGLVKELNVGEAQELVNLVNLNNYFHYKLKLPT